MSGLLPTIEMLACSEGYDEAADWLQRCPLSIIVSHHEEILKILIEKGFSEAVLCLFAELALALSVRAPDGTFQRRPQTKARHARRKMRLAASSVPYERVKQK